MERRTFLLSSMMAALTANTSKAARKIVGVCVHQFHDSAPSGGRSPWARHRPALSLAAKNSICSAAP